MADKTIEAVVGEPAGWNFQHDETGRVVNLTNDGVNNPENFARNNPRMTLIGPLYAHPAPALTAAEDDYVAAFFAGAKEYGEGDGMHLAPTDDEIREVAREYFRRLAPGVTG